MMRSNAGARRELVRMRRWLEQETAFVRFWMKASGFFDALERSYRADQPRVPRGSPDGGQWTSVGGSGRDRFLPRTAGGRVIFRAVLIRQNYDSSRDLTECLYYDSRYGYTFPKFWPGRTDCPAGAIH